MSTTERELTPGTGGPPANLHSLMSYPDMAAIHQMNGIGNLFGGARKSNGDYGVGE